MAAASEPSLVHSDAESDGDAPMAASPSRHGGAGMAGGAEVQAGAIKAASPKRAFCSALSGRAFALLPAKHPRIAAEVARAQEFAKWNADSPLRTFCLPLRHEA